MNGQPQPYHAGRPRPQPITARQAAFLAILINRSGKPAYLAAKRTLDIEHKTILRLTRREASALIQALQGVK